MEQPHTDYKEPRMIKWDNITNEDIKTLTKKLKRCDGG